MPTYGPLLTRAQFAKTAAARKPGASYQSYRSYVLNTRKRRAAARMAGTPAAQPGLTVNDLINRYYGMVPTPQQQLKTAQTQVSDQIAQQLAAERASTAAAQAQANKQANRAEGFALALAEATKPGADVALQAYRESADRLKAYGTGLTGSVAEAQQAAADQAAAKVAEMTHGRGAAPTGYDVPGLRSTAQYLGVVLPGRSLEEQALSARDEAESRRAAAAGQIGVLAQGYRSKTQDLQNELALKRQALEATRPGLMSQALESGRQSARQDMAALITALTLQGTQAVQAADITKGQETTAQGWAGIKGVDKQGNVLPGYYPQTDKKGKIHITKVPAGWVYDWAKGKLVKKAAGAGGAGGTGGLTPAQTDVAFGRSQKAINGVIQKAPYAVITNPTMVQAGLAKPKYGPGKLTYEQAKTKLLNAYFGVGLRKTPRAVSMVEDALSSIGYKKPGGKKPGKKPPQRSGPSAPGKKGPGPFK